MDNHSADFHRLTLLIQRILDADILGDADGTSLLTESEEACRSREEGNLEAACQHVVQVVYLTEALIGAHALAVSEGHAVIETAHRILAGDTH